ncbi:MULTISPECIES: glutathione binding-like protein [unclassified Janthinobacterium]|uniref:glutathione binding-like protein n=1 Tax=unclassified Janthinobacterium TaxID=2610881 RepID=UPI0017D2A212|nr:MULTISPECIES: glutathione binding-like protein [unclassified Janthinobacterium]MBB5371220.1 glutathione S-transferase [Janthinobacterium sp. K2C7]MBB5384026.1 glutathione S-transferase [Janthinobacterium sp. K2Li3]MBB5389152.1 glutathione S-transferase [Janthinobacterium sp. K2E3]
MRHAFVSPPHVCHICATVPDAYLAGREWLCGDSLSLADFGVAAPLMYSERLNLPLAQYQHLLAWQATKATPIPA